MKIFPRKDKVERRSGNFYFGDYGEIPIGISQTKIDENNVDKSKDTLHFPKAQSPIFPCLPPLNSRNKIDKFQRNEQ